MPDDASPAIATSTPGAGSAQGAFIDPDYRKRTMKYYPVSEPELGSLAQAETYIALFSAAATFFAGVAASIWVGVALLPEPEPAIAVVLRDVVLKLLVVLVLVLLIAVVIAWLTRKSTLDTIRKESKSVEIKVQS
jgi:hypothetical protein